MSQTATDGSAGLAVAAAQPATAAERHITLGAWLVGVGGVLLGTQVDAAGTLCGTGFTGLGIGALLALVAWLARVSKAGVPRDGFAMVATVFGVAGVAFVLGGVLAPGGPWMFAEVLLLLVVVLRGRARLGTPAHGTGTLVLLAVLFLFRLWITYQGSEHRWQLLSVPVPVISWLPFEWLRPVQAIELGSFTPREMGFPPGGLAFGPTLALWSLGFAACTGGLALLASARREHENDRIHALVHTLPPALAYLVERVLPEEEWPELGLHGASDRVLAKRIERLVGERLARQREIRTAFEASRGVHGAPGDEFAGGLERLLLHDGTRGRAP